MDTLREHLPRIVQFGAIKVAPGLVGMALIPLLYRFMGAEAYGAYSALQGAGLLIVSVFSSILTQPIYRFMSARVEEELGLFTVAALVLALAAGIGMAILGGLYAGSALTGGLLGLFAAAAILFGVYGVICQIRLQVARLAALEIVRIVLMLGLVLVQAVLAADLRVEHALAALAMSYALPLLPFLSGLPVAWPPSGWIVTRLGYGLKSAVWLGMAGLPFLVSKLVVGALSGPAVMGAFSAVVDLGYRILGLVAHAITMSIFPALSREYDKGQLGTVRRLYAMGMALYFAAGAAVLVLAAGILRHGAAGHVIGDLGPFTTLLILVACVGWQGLGISHKKAELMLRVGLNLRNMLMALTVFATLATLIIAAGTQIPAKTLPAAIVAAALWYISASTALHLPPTAEKRET